MRLIALAVLLALTLAAADTEAQPIPSRRIGFLNPASPVSMGPMHEAFREGLRELGWTEGQTVTIDIGGRTGTLSESRRSPPSSFSSRSTSSSRPGRIRSAS